MKKLLSGILVCCFVLSSAGLVFSAGKSGTAAEAEAMVKKAIVYVKAHGKEKAFAEFSNLKGQFVDRDLYITVYDMNGVCLAHGFNQKMVGKNMIDLKDPDGKPFVKERSDTAKTKDKFWLDYKYVNPLTKQIEQKSMYTEKMGDLLVNCGIYK
jgi:signal transduction histidine kinase